MSETKEPKPARKNILIALGIICIILVACLGGVVAAYTLVQNQVASDNSKINSLTSQLTNLQNPVEVVNRQFGLQFTMALRKTTYSLGEPINITFTITNVSNQTITVGYHALSFDFRVYNETNNDLYRYSETMITIQLVHEEPLNAGDSVTGSLAWSQTCYTTVFSEGVPVSLGTYYIVGYSNLLNGLQTTPIIIAVA